MTIIRIAMATTLLGCSSTTTSPNDAGLDAADAAVDATDAAVDAGVDTGCTVTTCAGTVMLSLGETVPIGDNCGDTCSFKVLGGGLASCGCSYEADCVCPDAGDE
jgi:hypothetical protein